MSEASRASSSTTLLENENDSEEVQRSQTAGKHEHAKKPDCNEVQRSRTEDDSAAAADQQQSPSLSLSSACILTLHVVPLDATGQMLK